MKKIFLPFIIIQSTILLFVFIFESILLINLAFEWIHYSVIIIDFIFIVIIGIINRKKLKIDDLFLMLGIFFTLIADFILIILGKYQAYGITVFICTQTCYFLYIFRNNKKSIFIVPFITIMALLIHLIFHNDDNYLIYIATLYGVIFITNITFSFIFKENLIFKIGLILFFFCDICVGLDSLQLYNDPHSLTFRFIWVFYLPSQVLISTFIYLKMKKE